MLILDSNPNCDQIRDSNDLIVLNWFFFLMIYFFEAILLWSISQVIKFQWLKISELRSTSLTQLTSLTMKSENWMASLCLKDWKPC